MLLLDSEALSALAHGPPGRRVRTRALIQEARTGGRATSTVTAVLAAVVRGRRVDAGIFATVSRERVNLHPVDRRVGVRAGQLLGRAGLGSEHAIDAFVAATADLAGRSVVATTDPSDMRTLAGHLRHVEIVDIG